MTSNANAHLERSTSLGYQVNHLARLLTQALRDRIAPHGVVPGQFAQLLALYEQDGLTQNELCQRVRIDQSTMAHTLNRMERDGLIHRAPDPTDRRRATITLAERARRVEPALVTAAREVNAIATRGLSAAETAKCLQLLSYMIDNLEEAAATD